MKDTLKPGLEYTHSFCVTDSKLVPALYPESPEYLQMPEVFATGFMVGFVEWACLKVINAHLDWPAEQSLGTHINVTHSAATPAGMEVTAHAKLVEVDGRRLVFEVVARDEFDEICRGTHERFVIDKSRFEAKLANKRPRG
ncbi:MAG: thioesterase family protein [Pseudomonadota bacterium]